MIDFGGSTWDFEADGEPGFNYLYDSFYALNTFVNYWDAYWAYDEQGWDSFAFSFCTSAALARTFAFVDKVFDLRIIHVSKRWDRYLTGV